MQLVVENPLNGDFYNTELKLPATKAEIKDAMHRGRAVGRNPENFGLVITQCTALPDLASVDFDSPTMEELNFFAKRLGQLTGQERVALKRVFNQRMAEGAYRTGVPMKELVNLTYGLDHVIVAPGVENDAQLGQFVIENDLNEDVSSIPENALYLLDKSQIGKLQREIDGGEYVDGNYIVTAAYEPSEIYDGVHLPELPGQAEEEEDAVFRLEVAKEPEGEQERQSEERRWISLPAEKEKVAEQIREQCGESIENCVYYGFESAIPQIGEEMFGTMQEFDLLNEIAQRYSVMSDMEQITFKAVLEHERPKNLAEAVEVMEHLPEYQLDYVSWDETDFLPAISSTIWIQNTMPDGCTILHSAKRMRYSLSSSEQALPVMVSSLPVESHCIGWHHTRSRKPAYPIANSGKLWKYWVGKHCLPMRELHRKMFQKVCTGMIYGITGRGGFPPLRNP